ncbi:unnamed protein product [Brassicogethes aeneus]|uniref:Glucose-methanol-choline oxidoreductase N-terminal domain-containing protein n=1 Tax=Brassicogethes aeneus TaxID=1431903 RepID=A0A9P0BAR5_BRAAE|nr:unnamed protein product [Brassicogethes aeneus]
MMKVNVVFFCINFVRILGQSVSDYEVLINKAIEEANSYTLDTDASRYKPKSEDIHDFGDFDYIILGGGTTGCVIANRLSEIQTSKVLILEAGQISNSVKTEIPSLYSQAGVSDFNWGFYSTPQKYGCQGFVNKSCPCPRGRGAGGTSLIHGLINSRANKIDFDRLAALGSSDWSYSNVLKYYKKSETLTQTNPLATIYPKYHGYNGPWSVENLNIENPRTTAFIGGNLELKSKKTDYNSAYEDGVSRLQVSKKDGKRADTATSYLVPILNRSNLVVSVESFVLKIEIDPETKCAQSVLFTKNGTVFRANAKREVILSAGAFNSPQILQLSGVGRRSELSKFNISVVSDLGAGENLIDHAVISLTLTHNTTDPEANLTKSIEDFLDNKGVLASTGAEGVVFFGKYPEIKLVNLASVPSPVPNVNLKVSRYSPSTLLDLALSNPKKSFGFLANVLATRSVGSVTLKSNSPYDYPLINSNVLSNAQDLENLYRLVEKVRSLTETNAFKKIDAKLVTPKLSACKGSEFDSKDYWFCVFKELAFPAYHPMGTCAMGKNPKKGAVVDPKLRVFGVKKLRVADASVFPFPIRAHPAANCVMLGEMVSDFVKNNKNKQCHC